MKNFILFLLVLGVSVFTPKKGYGQEYVIQTAEDLPDDDLTDNIWQPKSLRAAIENINKNKVPAKINCSLFEYKTLKINSSLHVINVRVEFDAKGMVLEPSATSTATYGLWFTGNNSILKNIKIRGFNGIGLVWQASDGLIANSVFSNNNGPGINMNNAHRNRIGDTTIGYYNILLYGNKRTGGSGLAMIKCNNNIIQYC